MPGRKFTSGSYRYGFNGQERSKELNNDSYTAEFWQYDGRLGRRWNLDPQPDVHLSAYGVFANNPIFNADPLGDTSVPRAGGGYTVDIDEKVNSLEFYKNTTYR